MTGESSVLRTNIAGVMLRNPVILAAGTHGTLDEFNEVCPLDRVGALVTKSITPEPRDGNPTWRVIPARAGMINAIGLANPGIARFERHLAERLASVPTMVIGSVAGFSIDDYVRVVAGFEQVAAVAVNGSGSSGAGLELVELNVSCPNVRTGTEFGHTPALIRELLLAVRPAAPRLKLIVKLSPVCHDIVAVAKAAIEAGAEALTICNTIPAMAIDVESRRPRLANITGGLSGPAIHPVALRLVHEVYRKVTKDAHGTGRAVPIIGAGGVTNWRDAAEFILAGASAVEIGTALFADPRAPLKVVRGLERWVIRQRAATISELVGSMISS
ncbi:MAG: dihydroorotate dehydrogenase [Phycisphaerales bacterium]|nr:dihydroorotate dehydrogenase [Phycisphaerales bacterium]